MIPLIIAGLAALGAVSAAKEELDRAKAVAPKVQQPVAPAGYCNCRMLTARERAAGYQCAACVVRRQNCTARFAQSKVSTPTVVAAPKPPVRTAAPVQASTDAVAQSDKLIMRWVLGIAVGSLVIAAFINEAPGDVFQGLGLVVLVLVGLVLAVVAGAAILFGGILVIGFGGMAGQKAAQSHLVRQQAKARQVELAEQNAANLAITAASTAYLATEAYEAREGRQGW